VSKRQRLVIPPELEEEMTLAVMAFVLVLLEKNFRSGGEGRGIKQ
jgi:hypothetical protein